MEKKRSATISIVGAIILLYGLSLFSCSIPLTRKLLYQILSPFKSLIHFISLSSLLALPIGILYLISSIAILGLRDWGRKIVIWLSALISIPLVLTLIGSLVASIRGELEGPAAIGLLPLVLLVPFYPVPIFLIFFILPRVKEQFK